LLQIFRLLLAGGILLLWVCWKMWLELHETHDCRSGRGSMLVQSPVNSRRFRPQP
jgi:predicted tellurium resistance membrane protein TerC